MKAWALVLLLGACGPRTPPTSSRPGAPIDAAVAVVPVIDAGPPAFSMACVAGPGRGEFNPLDRRGAVDATDGVHTDACDAHGDLISYQCEVRDMICPPDQRGRGGRHEVAPCWELTGGVTETVVPCDGRCRDGACPSRCPNFGDRLTYGEISGSSVVFVSDHDARRLACTLGFDQDDAYDCTSDPRVGDVLVIEGLGMSTSLCTAGVIGAISDKRCTYTTCQYVD